MIFTRIKLDNFYSFKNSEVDLSFKRMPVDTTIPYEYLEGRDKFYFKRVCILSGANASGKTSFGRMLFEIQQFLIKKRFSFDLINAISQKNEPASFEVDFVTHNTLTMHRVYVSINVKGDINKLIYASTKIGKNDSCNKATKKLDEIIQQKTAPRGGRYLTASGKDILINIIKFNKLLFGNNGWYYTLSENSNDVFDLEQDKKYLKASILKCILKSFDPSIEDVSESFILNKKANKTEINGYQITFSNQDDVFIDINRHVTNKERLSRGTYDAIEVASLIAWIISDKQNEKRYKENNITSIPNSIYFLDEKMAFAHSELEQAIINTIITNLGRHSQFFYTTHNYDILELNLPVHSYLFTRKVDNVTEFIEPAETYKKNDRNLLNYVKNNMFQTLPDTYFIDNLPECSYDE